MAEHHIPERGDKAAMGAARPQNVGILAMDVYFPASYVAQVYSRLQFSSLSVVLRLDAAWLLSFLGSAGEVYVMAGAFRDILSAGLLSPISACFDLSRCGADPAGFSLFYCCCRQSFNEQSNEILLVPY